MQRSHRPRSCDARVRHAGARARERRPRCGCESGGGRTAGERGVYDVFKWLNYVRRTVRTMREADAGVSASALAEACRSGTASRAWDDDSYMTPEDADDAALFGFEATSTEETTTAMTTGSGTTETSID